MSSPPQQEEDAQKRIAQLERRLQAFDAFTIAVSQELRESLFAIGGFVRAVEIEDTRIDPKTHSRLRHISDAVLRMERVIDDTVALTRSEGFVVEKVDVQLGEMVALVLRDFRRAYPSTRVITSELPMIHADPVVVRHVLVNVLANAFGFSALAPAPTVEISIDATGALQVIDNGIGFDGAAAANLLKPFQRLTTDPAYPGLGLGLAAAKYWLNRHGGRISGESRKGGPTRFTIAFED